MNFRYSSHLVFYPTNEFGLPEKIIFGFCLYASVCLILRMWLKYRKDPFLKKLFWSITLLMPLAGWVFYARFYNPFPESPLPAERYRTVRTPSDGRK